MATEALRTHDTGLRAAAGTQRTREGKRSRSQQRPARGAAAKGSSEMDIQGGERGGELGSQQDSRERDCSNRGTAWLGRRAGRGVQSWGHNEAHSCQRTGQINKKYIGIY